jgi:hypothetical protein
MFRLKPADKNRTPVAVKPLAASRYQTDTSMTRIYRGALYGIGPVLLVLVCATALHADDPTDDPADALAAARQENAELRAELERVKSAYDRLEAQTGRLRADLAELGRKNEDLSVQTRELTELAGLTPLGDRVESALSRFTSTFDPQTGRTVVRTGVERLRVTRGSAADHRLSLAYSYPGQQMQTPPATVSLFIQAKFSGGVYREQDTVTLDIDGEAVDVPIADYDAVTRRVRVAGKRTLRKDDETLTVEIDAELLRRLARAIQVRITVGPVHLEPTRDQTALFRAVQKRIGLGA